MNTAQSRRNLFIRFSTLGLLLGIQAVLMTQRVNMATADLGRHIKNGEIILSELSVMKTNLYSYTHPDYPFVNHHWGSGVVFFLIHKAFGFKGVSVFWMGLSLATFLVFFGAAANRSSFEIAALVSLFILPVVASRAEIRPEGFSYFFIGVFLLLLSRHQDGEISGRKLWVLAALELIWVNLHVYFFMGFFLVGIFFIEALARFFLRHEPDEQRKSRELAALLAAMAVVIFINPNAAAGALYPSQIFQNYGYRLAENQSVWFIARLFRHPASLYFKISFGLLVLSWIAGVARGAARVPWVNITLGAFFGAMGWMAIRNFSLFGYMALPLVSANLAPCLEIGGVRTRLKIWWPAMGLAAGFTLFYLDPDYFRSRRSLFGLGLAPGVERAAQFFRQENISGPIFNNYDNGAYLIYYLYPYRRVFVDNRPEAYPTSFFEKIYVPMQEDARAWARLEPQYDFNAIFFFRHDATPWGQNFLVQRIQDPAWAPVFVDDHHIIFLKRNQLNAGIIHRYELPRSMFSIKRPG